MYQGRCFGPGQLSTLACFHSQEGAIGFHANIQDRTKCHCCLQQAQGLLPQKPAGSCFFTLYPAPSTATSSQILMHVCLKPMCYACPHYFWLLLPPRLSRKSKCKQLLETDKHISDSWHRVIKDFACAAECQGT
eukprot:1158567-Pelagomonas_calceolata.AAC.6